MELKLATMQLCLHLLLAKLYPSKPPRVSRSDFQCDTSDLFDDIAFVPVEPISSPSDMSFTAPITSDVDASQDLDEPLAPVGKRLRLFCLRCKSREHKVQFCPKHRRAGQEWIPVVSSGRDSLIAEDE